MRASSTASASSSGSTHASRSALDRKKPRSTKLLSCVVQCSMRSVRGMALSLDAGVCHDGFAVLAHYVDAMARALPCMVGHEQDLAGQVEAADAPQQGLPMRFIQAIG